MLNYKMSNGGILQVSDYAYKRMLAYIQDKPDLLEAGGIMLGRFIINSKNIIIDEVSVPMLGDKRTRTSFFRSEKPHQKFAEGRWEKTGGRVNYLGEWHTHPENYPTPSEVDKTNWIRILKKGDFTSRYLHFVIFGIKEVRIWEGDWRTRKIKQLDRV